MRSGHSCRWSAKREIIVFKWACVTDGFTLEPRVRDMLCPLPRGSLGCDSSPIKASLLTADPPQWSPGPLVLLGPLEPRAPGPAVAATERCSLLFWRPEPAIRVSAGPFQAAPPVSKVPLPTRTGGPAIYQCDLILTNDICNDPIPQEGPIQRSWGLQLQSIWGDATHPVTLPFFWFPTTLHVIK